MDFTIVKQVPLGRNAALGTMQVDTSRFNATIHDHIYDYGLRQILNDAMADKTDDDGNRLPDDQIVAKAQKRLDSLYAGELRTRGVGSDPVDPVERIAWGIARENIGKALRALGFMPKKGTDKLQRALDAQRAANNAAPMTLDEYIPQWLDKRPAVRKSAERIHNEEMKHADVSELL